MSNPPRFLRALIALVLPLLAVRAAEPNPTTVKAALWQPVELTLQAAKAPAAPFEAEVFVTARSSNAELKVPAYYDGNGVYRVRFCPPAAGTWTVTSQAGQADLNGRQWAVEVTPSSDRLAPLGLSPRDPTRFARVGGKDVALLAFECDWLWALDHGDAAMPRVRRLLQEIAANGFNQVVLNLYAHDVRWPRPPGLPKELQFSPPSAFPFGGNNDTPDHTTLNLDYFRHFDRLVALMDEMKISAHVMIYVWNKKVNWPAARSAEDNRYFDYVIKRYQGFPNIVWDVSKEALGYGHDDMDYITDRIGRIRALDAHHRLVTVHDYSYCNRNPDKVDFISVQQWKTELYGAMREIFAKHANKPVFNIEHGGYERGPYDVFSGDYDDPIACLDRNYQCLFAGCDSTYYWQDTSWNVLIWEPWTLPEKDRPRWDYFRHMRKLIDAIDAAGLKPHERGASSGFCLSDYKDVFVYYVPAGNTRINITAKETGSKEAGKLGVFSVHWFDPLTGEFSDGGIMKDIAPWYPLRKPKSDRAMIAILRRQAAD